MHPIVLEYLVEAHVADLQRSRGTRKTVRRQGSRFRSRTSRQPVARYDCGCAETC